MSNRLDKEREEMLQPKRMEYAIEQLTGLGFNVVKIDDTKLRFIFKENWVTLYPYSGWHTGKSIKDGRGLQKLLNQIK